VYRVGRTHVNEETDEGSETQDTLNPSPRAASPKTDIARAPSHAWRRLHEGASPAMNRGNSVTTTMLHASSGLLLPLTVFVLGMRMQDRQTGRQAETWTDKQQV
jgi:hypothetical protein